MKIGISTSCADWSVGPAAVARIAEEAGFDVVAFGEHTHIPAARETPYPGRGGEMPPGYERLLDLFVVLTSAALATTRIKIGTGILQVVQRDPISTAKAAASVDLISAGRLFLITGSSWNVDEMRNHGTDPATRYELLEERVLAMREIWDEGEATFHGRFVNFDRIWSWPKPVQKPLPVLIGGNSEGVEARALRAGTGWAPLHAPGVDARVQRYLQGAARDGVDTTVTVVGSGVTADVLDAYANAGAERWINGIGLVADEGQFASEVEHVLRVQAEFAGTT